MNELEARITDAEREQAVSALHEACLDGRLTLEEFSERMEKALAARTRGELAPVTADLVRTASAISAPRAAPAPTRWLIAVMGSRRQRGRWRLGERNTAVAVMGDCELDLRHAEVSGGQVTITAIALMGGVKVIVPDGIRVEVDGTAIMGDVTSNMDEDASFGGAPLIRVQAYAMMGEVKVQRQQEPQTQSAWTRLHK